MTYPIRRDDVPPPSATCPKCRRPPVRAILHCKDATLWTASYLDTLGHTWETKWAASIDGKAA